MLLINKHGSSRALQLNLVLTRVRRETTTSKTNLFSLNTVGLKTQTSHTIGLEIRYNYTKKPHTCKKKLQSIPSMDKIKPFIQYSENPKSHQNEPKQSVFFLIPLPFILLNKDFNVLKHFDSRARSKKTICAECNLNKGAL